MPVSLKELKHNQAIPTNDNLKVRKNLLEDILTYQVGRQRLKDSFKESFYSELALLLEAGMNIKSALELLGKEQKKQYHRNLVANIEEQLTQGGRFSEVLEKQGTFTAYEYFSIRIGEETGNMIEILRRLALFYSQKIQQRRTLIGALTYPVVILLTALMAVTFMLTYMIPMFQDVFTRMGGELPALTRMIIKVADGFGYFAKIILLLGVVMLLLHLRLRNKTAYRKFRSVLILRIPLIGQMIRRTHILRLIQSLSLLMSSKVPLTEALDLSQKMLRFYPIEHSLEQIQKDILQGASLYEGMVKFSIYDQRLVSLIKVGEETNQLSLIFSKLSAQMEEELQHKAKILGSTLEPLIIVFLGFIVAILLISMYLPMFRISGSF